MPLALYFRPSFQRSLKTLGAEQLEVVERILGTLEIYYASGCKLEDAQRAAARFFYKQLRKPYYEAGVESNIRVVIAREKDKCIASFVGNHDQIRKFLAAN